MISAVDNTFLTLLLNQTATPRANPATGKPIDYHRERIESLIDEIDDAKGTLIVPSPALAEVLCVLDPPDDYIVQLQSYSCIRIVGFDVRSAITFARDIRAAISNGDKRSGVIGAWQHVKMDRQIVAIAKAHGATTLYSDDDKQTRFAHLVGLAVKHSWELTLSPERAQAHLAKDPNAWPKQTKPTSRDASRKPPAS